ncbi:hypothetical protein GJ496_010937 [Pomphorhynchus laevis]|nr:hypothetical protein GJ496_010937 [Pomphorhynchus laevis]
MDERLENIIQLPFRFEGLGIAFPHRNPGVEYNRSREMYIPLLEGATGENLMRAQEVIASHLRCEREVVHRLNLSAGQSMCEPGFVILDYSACKGTSTWLSAKPIVN